MTKTIKILSLIALLTAAVGCATADDMALDSTVGSSQADSSVRGGFDLWKAESGEWYFHLEAGNHEILLASEGYQSRTGALGGVLAILNNGGLEHRYQIISGSDGQFYVSLKARNGEIIGTSEGYTSKQGADRLIAASIGAVANYLEHWDSNTGARFQVFEGKGGQFYFNLYAGNGEIVLSSEGYVTEASALNGAFSVADNGVDPENFDIEEATDGSFYLNLRAANGEIIGTSELYSTRSNARAAATAIANLIPDAELL